MENPDISKIKNRVRQSRDIVDRLLSSLPGYKTYVESAEAFDSDRIVREYLADRIIRLKSAVTTFASELVRKGEHKTVKEIESVTIFMERILKKCQYADYSGTIFAKMRLTPEDTAKLVEYDTMLLSLLDETEKLVSDLDRDGAVIVEILSGIKNKLKNFEKAYEDRKFKIMEGI